MTLKKILIVDDDATLRMALTRYLHAQGYHVQYVASAEEGVQAFSENSPDLIVSDVIMPGMGGLEFCRQVRATRIGKLTPFIFLSGRGDLNERIEGHQMGADDYLVKPFDFRELVAKIESQLERFHQIQDEIIKRIQQTNASFSRQKQLEPPPLPLTPAEEKVFWEVIQGFTNKQIGDRLFVSPRTVQTHLSNILNKLDLENRSQLVRYAFEHGYCPPVSSKF